MGPDGEEPLFKFLSEKLRAWQTELLGYRTLAETGSYPGTEEISESLRLIQSLLGVEDSSKFIQRFNENKTALRDLVDDYHDLDHFYRHQKPVWEKLRKASEKFTLNRLELERDEQAAPALARIGEILKADSPYSLIKEADGLISRVEEVNSRLISEARMKAEAVIDARRKAVELDLNRAEAHEGLKAACLPPFEELRHRLSREHSLAHIGQLEREADRLVETAIQKLEQFLKSKESSKGEPPKLKTRTVVRPSTLLSGEYLETRREVSDFLDRLRDELERAIDRGERIQIK